MSCKNQDLIVQIEVFNQDFADKNRVKVMTCTRKITPSGRRESTKIKIGDSSDEKDIYGRADRRDSAWI
jgi:hypothetical protein